MYNFVIDNDNLNSTHDNMTIRSATSYMLTIIRAMKSFKDNIYYKDKDIAKYLGISPVTYSRLITGVQNPNIETWATITSEFKHLATEEQFNKLIKEEII